MFSFRIALRYLFSKKSHNAVNVISIVSILGVAVATMAIMCVLSVFNGFTDLAVNRLTLMVPDLKVETRQGKVMPAADSVAARLGALSEVALALPTITENALAIYDGAQMAVEMHGVTAGYDRVTDIASAMVDGEFLTANVDAPVATLSLGVAIKLEAYTFQDQLLKLYVPKRTGRINSANPMASFRADSLFVGGVYRVEDNDFDRQTIYIPLDIARRLLEYDNGEASAIDIAIAPGHSEEQARRAIEAVVGSDFVVKNRIQQEAQSFKMISVEKWITFVMLAFILIIASFNVVSTLSMLIIEKRDNMRTLRSLGATTGSIRRIFLWEGWLISAVGGLLGILLGIALCLAQQMFGLIKLGGDPQALAVESYPVRVDVADIVIVAALVVVVGFAVGLLTSRFVPKAKK